MKRNEESVYKDHADTMRDLLQDPSVNSREHAVYWPRLQAMLPPEASRVLDFGCGPGNFTYELATMYPEAEIVGVDKQINLMRPNSGNLTFMHWDGTTPLQINDRFDLIMSKMTLHYLSDSELRALAANLLRLFAPGGRIVFSAPHPADSVNYNNKKRHEWQKLNGTGSIKREIGATGIEASMYHRNIAEWINWMWGPLKEAYPELSYTVAIDDDICDKNGMPKRLDIALLPANDPDHGAIYQRIEKFPGSRVEHILEVDPHSPLGRRAIYGELFEPPTPLP